jgi:hypothetical protein
MTADNKINATKICLRRASGPSDRCTGWVEFTGGDCWKNAHEWLWNQAHTFPKEGSGRDKVDLRVIYADDDMDDTDSGYHGRLNCGHFSRGNPDLCIGSHMRTHLHFVGGLNKPLHLTRDEYREYLTRLGEESQQSARDMLDRYEIKSSDQLREYRGW